MQYEKILMVWVRITRGWKPSVIRTQTINIFVLHENKQGVTNLSLSKHEFYSKSFENDGGKCLENSSFYIFHNVAINFSFEDIQAWLTTMRVVSIDIT